jgi:hypothetical protein
VALGIGGLAESVEHEVTGLLADDVAGLVGQAQRLVAERALRERLSRNALERARGLGWQSTAERTLELLQGEVDRAAGPRAVLRVRPPAPIVVEPAEEAVTSAPGERG